MVSDAHYTSNVIPLYANDEGINYIRSLVTTLNALTQCSLSDRCHRIFNVVLTRSFANEKAYTTLSTREIAAAINYTGALTHIRSDLRRLEDQNLILRHGVNIYPNPHCEEWINDQTDRNQSVSSKNTDKWARKITKNKGLRKSKGSKSKGKQTEKRPQTDRKTASKSDSTVESFNNTESLLSDTQKPPEKIPEKAPAPKLEPDDDRYIVSPSGHKWGNEHDVMLAKHIYQRVNERREISLPHWYNWANEIRLTREQDGRDPRHIRALFDYAMDHSWWRDAIEGPASLRKNWRKLGLARQKERNSGREPETRPSGTGNASLDKIKQENKAMHKNHLKGKGAGNAALSELLGRGRPAKNE